MDYRRTAKSISELTKKFQEQLKNLRACIDAYAIHDARVHRVVNSTYSWHVKNCLGLESEHRSIDVVALKKKYLLGNKNPRTRDEIFEANALEKEVKDCRRELALAEVSMEDIDWYLEDRVTKDQIAKISATQACLMLMNNILNDLRDMNQDGKIAAFRLSNDPIYTSLIARMNLYPEMSKPLEKPTIVLGSAGGMAPVSPKILPTIAYRKKRI